jgi:hypothetical protein
MVRDRNRRAVIAGVATILWFGYMMVVLPVVNATMPTVGGQGPEGTAAFIGLVTGVVWAGVVMWAASD